ncbi:MAG: hypothetical protein U0P48_08700 [Ancrocorticia sp.]
MTLKLLERLTPIHTGTKKSVSDHKVNIVLGIARRTMMTTASALTPARAGNKVAILPTTAPS